MFTKKLEQIERDENIEYIFAEYNVVYFKQRTFFGRATYIPLLEDVEMVFLTRPEIAMLSNHLK